MSISIMRLASWPAAISVLAIGLSLGASGRAQAGGPLNPLDFASLGAFPTATGGIHDRHQRYPHVDRARTGTILTGVVFNGIAVFDFDSINVLRPSSFTVTGSLPLAFLSRTDATIAGQIGGRCQGYTTPRPRWGTRGGGSPFPSGGGPGGGGAGQFGFGASGGGSGGGGGGFGGPGGAGAGLLRRCSWGPRRCRVWEPRGNNFKPAAAVVAAVAQLMVVAVVAPSRSAPLVP